MQLEGRTCCLHCLVLSSFPLKRMQSQTGHCLPLNPPRGAVFNHTPSSNPLWVLRKDSICFVRRILLSQEEQMGPVQAEMEGKEGKALEAH